VLASNQYQEEENQNTINEEQIRTINKRRLKISLIIYPDSSLRHIIDFVSFTLIFLISLYIPFVFSFNVNQIYGPGRFFELFLDCWFIMEILLNFITGYYEKGVLVLDRKKIAINYLHNWFLADILSCFPYTLLYIFRRDNGS
jgi:hypothetical protein